MANDVKYAKTDQALRRLTLEQYRATHSKAHRSAVLRRVRR